MTKIARERIQTIYQNAITGTDTQSSPSIPTGQIWQVSRIIFADKGINDGLSGAFLVDFGSGGSREVIAAAYLTGNTIVLPIDRTFLGDGSKVFRFIRVNNSVVSKEMFLMVEGFKRIGDV